MKLFLFIKKLKLFYKKQSFPPTSGNEIKVVDLHIKLKLLDAAGNLHSCIKKNMETMH